MGKAAARGRRRAPVGRKVPIFTERHDDGVADARRDGERCGIAQLRHAVKGVETRRPLGGECDHPDEGSTRTVGRGERLRGQYGAAPLAVADRENAIVEGVAAHQLAKRARTIEDGVRRVSVVEIALRGLRALTLRAEASVVGRDDGVAERDPWKREVLKRGRVLRRRAVRRDPDRRVRHDDDRQRRRLGGGGEIRARSSCRPLRCRGACDKRFDKGRRRLLDALQCRAT